MAPTLMRLAESGRMAEGVDWLDSIEDADERARGRPFLVAGAALARRSAASSGRLFGIASGSTTSTERRFGGVMADRELVAWLGDRARAACDCANATARKLERDSRGEMGGGELRRLPSVALEPDAEKVELTGLGWTWPERVRWAPT